MSPLAALRALLWRAKLRVRERLARLLGPPSYRPPAIVQRDLLAGLAMLWDGRWFLKTRDAHGVADAFERNAEVRVSMGRTEMRLLLKAAGRDRAKDLDDAAQFVRAHGEMLMGPAGGLAFRQARRGDGALDLEVLTCAAHEGAKEAMRRGLVPRADAPCVACCDLWRAWFSVLLPGEDVDVWRGDYQGAGAAKCEFRFKQVEA